MDQNERLHHEWIGMAQPEGLVVTAHTLKAAEANITWPITELQEALRELAGPHKTLLHLPLFFRDILGWSEEFVVSGEDIPPSLRIAIEGSAPLTPDFAVKSADDDGAFVLLVGRADARGGDLDAASDDKRWSASPHQRFERLLRETGVPVGLLSSGKALRLVYAPKGETAGWVTFRLPDLLTIDGRPLLGALHMLLNQRRLLSLEPERRLLGLLKASREYQNTVSSALREQVLAALRELLVGFQHADRLAQGQILGDYRRGHLGEVYQGLVTVLMRSVFVLFAEEQNLLPVDRDLYASSYSLTRLYAQLAEDRDRYGDTIEDRYGAWARVIALFRLLHDGVRAADGLFLPARKGDLFNPDKFPFLEGRPRASARQVGEVLDLPRVSDGVVYRVLDQLLMLGGERLQYKGLDVEQVGSVYEGLMGFEVEVATGDSLALMPEHVVVNLTELLALPGGDRVKRLKALANLDVKDKAAAEVKAAGTVAALQAALSRRVSSRQPGLLVAGSLYLQPGEERRKTGSHYTPKSLTSPIVETTLKPVLERLGAQVSPQQILDLCVCDPAMGSGAFLVESCRQLADHLVSAWRRTGTVPALPPDEDVVLHARRLIAQQCLYGVDKNPLAVDLARLSLWLVTFAREHPFTFVDHALRCGDSLVGLSREQIASLTLEVGKGQQIETVRQVVQPAVQQAEALRDQIHAIGDPPDNAQLVKLWEDAEHALGTVRLLGDLIIASYFSADSDKARKKALEELRSKVTLWLATGQHDAELRGEVADLQVKPFHWEIEFPEVFSRENPGFDCFVGNPPFAGKNSIIASNHPVFVDWLHVIHEESHGNADLVSHFFRRAFHLLRRGGTCGLIATNTIAQGDTRSTGLRWICKHDGVIFAATRRKKWPGAAAVIVSVVYYAKSPAAIAIRLLDGQEVSNITAFLFHRGGDDDPSVLRVNEGRAFIGTNVVGEGFKFDDTDKSGKTWPLATMHKVVDHDLRNQERIFPFIGGEEINDSPTHTPHRYIIDFGEMSEDEARRWPDLIALLEERVRPRRQQENREAYRRFWWRHGERRVELYRTLATRQEIFACSQTSKYRVFGRLPARMVFSTKAIVFVDSAWSIFAVLQARPHELWSTFFGSSMKDDPVYTPSDCFETFPFPPLNDAMEAIGKDYYEFRAALMIRNNEGLTKTYNRFHNPNPEEQSADILKLRELHAQMDRAVLDAYGWSDLEPVYDFREQLDESIRLTWAEDTRDEVLARLLELNRTIAEVEAPAVPLPKRAKKTPKVDLAIGDLFSTKR